MPFLPGAVYPAMLSMNDAALAPRHRHWDRGRRKPCGSC